MVRCARPASRRFRPRASWPSITAGRATAGNALAHVEVSTPTVVVSVRQTEFAHAEPAAAGEIVKADPGALDAKGAQVLGIQATKSERPELTEARVVVSGGRGMREGKNFEILGQLA